MSMPLLAPILDSISAHLGAKLGEFISDERTLTDELCDMACIWTGSAPVYPWYPPSPFVLALRKTTTSEEVWMGADLELVIVSPSGWKRALFQAKVVDPGPSVLRGSRTADWKRLRRQLADMRKQEPDTSFLLLYVPSSELDGRGYGYGTWEQGFAVQSGAVQSRFGACAIPVDAILTKSNRWKSNSIRYVNSWLAASPVSLARVVLELMVCQRGAWRTDDVHGGLRRPERYEPFRRLVLGISEVPVDEWEGLSSAMRSYFSTVPDAGPLGAV
jgi:hypothetical protein